LKEFVKLLFRNREPNQPHRNCRQKLSTER